MWGYSSYRRSAHIFDWASSSSLVRTGITWHNKPIGRLLNPFSLLKNVLKHGVTALIAVPLLFPIGHHLGLHCD